MQIDTLLQKIPVRRDTTHNEMAWIPAGQFLMGAADGEGFAEEHPQHGVSVNGFWMDTHEVTNAEFNAFVKATGYITTAEQKPDWEVLKLQVPPGTPKPPDSVLVAGFAGFYTAAASSAFRWMLCNGGVLLPAPTGNTRKGRAALSKEKKNIRWCILAGPMQWLIANGLGKRLPTEAEWEWAAKGGIKDAKYGWGKADLKDGFYPANIWQGTFPNKNTAADGYTSTAPVQSFAANGFGLYDMSGNVWEWVADWMDAGYYSTLGQHTINPTGPADGSRTSHPYQKVLKGGSFLCHASYCTGYRVARRSSNGWDSGSNHIGFRCVKG